MSRDASARARWAALSPYQRRLLVSHRPDELESEERLVRSVRAALCAVFGPVTHSPRVATIDDGEDDGDAYEGQELGATLSEIAAEFGVSRERARQMVLSACEKFRREWEKQAGAGR